MKIIFNKMWQERYIAKYTEPIVSINMYFSDHIIDPYDHAAIQAELDTRFSSLEMQNYCPFIFSFKDQADEAAFLLWSSEGIDL